MKWNVRVFTEITFDFEIEAETEEEVGEKIESYLPYIKGGKTEKQPVSVKVGPDDKLTNIFIEIKEIEDVYELDTTSFADRGA